MQGSVLCIFFFKFVVLLFSVNAVAIPPKILEI